MTNQKTILLTGATGFLGSELLKRFILIDYNVKALVRSNKKTNLHEKIYELLSDTGFDSKFVNSQLKNLQVIEGDITKSNLGLNSQILQELENSVHEVFHCAAATKFFGLSRKDLINTNYVGTKNIINFCVSGQNKHLNYISTAYVAGKKQNIVYEDELDNSSGFHNDYEVSKFLAENAVHQYALSHKLHYTIYRPSIIIGNSTTNYTMNFDGIYTFARALFLLKQEFKSIIDKSGVSIDHPLKRFGVHITNDGFNIPVRIPGTPGSTINLVPIDYVTNAIVSIFHDKFRINKSFHIVNPNPPKLNFILKSICETFGITGLEIVPSDDYQAKEMTYLEKKICKNIKAYDLYMHDEPSFISNNSLEILNNFCIECPKITKGLISSLINFAITNNWGNNLTVNG